MKVNLMLGMNVAEDRSSFVSARFDSFVRTYQVLPQLFVVGDDAIVNDNKCCGRSGTEIRQKRWRPNVNLPDEPVDPPTLS